MSFEEQGSGPSPYEVYSYAITSPGYADRGFAGRVSYEPPSFHCPSGDATLPSIQLLIKNWLANVRIITMDVHLVHHLILLLLTNTNFIPMKEGLKFAIEE